MALRTWEEDTGGGTNISPKENIPIGLNRGQLAWVDAMGFTNVLQSAKVLRCPQDTKKPPINPAFPVRISYFLNLDANETYPQLITAGDDNLAIGDEKYLRSDNTTGVYDVVMPGILEITTNTIITWTWVRHGHTGNISFADGSVAEESTSGLMNSFQYNFNGTPATTNRLAIP
jgi:prepilin-type processing-associated H-X9-DG protein